MDLHQRLIHLKDIRWAFDTIEKHAIKPKDYRKKDQDAILSVISSIRSQLQALMEDASQSEE